MPTFRLGSSPLVHAPGLVALAINAASDAEAIAMASKVARDMMLVFGFPETIDADECREGLIAYIDRVDAEGRNEIAEVIEFDGAYRLFPRAAAPISRLARLQLDDASGEADLRQLLGAFVLEARDITPDVSPRSDLPVAGEK